MNPASDRLDLSQVTLCAVTSVNVTATIMALERCLAAASFGDSLLFTDAVPAIANPAIRHIPIDRLDSAEAYSHFVLRHIAPHVHTSHLLLVQWDGFIIEPGAWHQDFLAYDYIGAAWPQFITERDVGNGGFSLRSKRLLTACLDPSFKATHPEDLAICHDNRELLEQKYAIRFADTATAGRFAFERMPATEPCFGFHGVFNIPAVVGRDEFWSIYRSLDDRGTIRPDFFRLLRKMLRGPHGLRRTLQMLADRFGDWLRN